MIILFTALFSTNEFSQGTFLLACAEILFEAVIVTLLVSLLGR